jgi:DNA-3-methyladenine glycosylase I
MAALAQLIEGADGKSRCSWCGNAPDYVAYHDNEWGFPVTDDRRLFEKLCLEGFQAGLSWLTILRKREGFRRAFLGFEFNQVAQLTDADVERIVMDASIVRHRGKILSTINNARRAIEVVEEFGSLSAFLWSFEGKDAKVLASALKKRGWTFVGPTTVYAFMQAMGLVDDHAEGCHVRQATQAARSLHVK